MEESIFEPFDMSACVGVLDVPSAAACVVKVQLGAQSVKFGFFPVKASACPLEAGASRDE